MIPEEQESFDPRLDNLEKNVRTLKFYLLVATLVFLISAITGLFLYLALSRDFKAFTEPKLQELGKVERRSGSSGIAQVNLGIENYKGQWDPYMLLYNPGGKDLWTLPDQMFQQNQFLPSPKAAPAKPSPQPMGVEAKKIGSNEFVIKRRDINASLGSMNNFIAQARIIPNWAGEGDDREVEGLMIFRIQPGSFFALLGLQNGDIIKSINGNHMNGIEQGLLLLQNLWNQNDHTVTLQIERQNNILELKCKIQEEPQ